MFTESKSHIIVSLIKNFGKQDSDFVTKDSAYVGIAQRQYTIGATQKKLSTTQVAELAGMGRTTLVKIEMGHPSSGVGQ